MKQFFLNLKCATHRDSALIRSMADVCFRDTYKKILSSEQLEYMMEMMYSEKKIKEQMEEGDQYYFVFNLKQNLIGYFSISQKTEALFYLEKIYLLPEFQGQGFGKSLFLKVLQLIQKEYTPIFTLRLHVNRFNKALSFYKKQGLKIVEEGDYFIGNGFYMNDYIMELCVDSEV